MMLSIGMRLTPALAQPADGDILSAVEDFGNLDEKEKSAILSAYGVEGSGGGFSWAKMIAWTLFGGIGFIAAVYGKKQENFKALIIGIVLCVYPYFVPSTFWLYAVGMGLCGVLYYWRD